MKWPWVRRESRETADLRERLRVCEHAARFNHEVLTHSLNVAEFQRDELRTRVDALEAERRTLLDRIVQMSGQQALYEKPGPRDTRTEGIADREPEKEQLTPRTKTSFEDVHAATRTAMQNGTFDMPKGRAN